MIETVPARTVDAGCLPAARASERRRVADRPGGCRRGQVLRVSRESQVSQLSFFQMFGGSPSEKGVLAWERGTGAARSSPSSGACAYSLRIDLLFRFLGARGKPDLLVQRASTVDSITRVIDDDDHVPTRGGYAAQTTP